MSDRITATHQYLLTNYGPLLTLKHLAELIDQDKDNASS